MEREENTVIITVEEVLTETDNAFCLMYEGKEVWFPKSQIRGCDFVQGDTDIEVEATQWILEKKGLV